MNGILKRSILLLILVCLLMFNGALAKHILETKEWARVLYAGQASGSRWVLKVRYGK